MTKEQRDEVIARVINNITTKFKHEKLVAAGLLSDYLTLDDKREILDRFVHESVVLDMVDEFFDSGYVLNGDDMMYIKDIIRGAKKNDHQA